MQTDKDRQLGKENQIMKMNLEQQNLHNQYNNQSNQIDQQIYSKDLKTHQEAEQHIQSQQQQVQDNGDYDYDQYQYYDENADYMLDQTVHNFESVQLTQKNTQCTMEHLTKIIEKQIKTVSQLTGFDREWAFLLYHSCAWKMVNVENVIDEKLSSHQIVKYKPSKAQISKQEGQCTICCSQFQTLIKNLCGDQFCLLCWKQSIKAKMNENYLDPFPSCLNENCETKTSPFILEVISLNDESFKKLYLKTLCRSYAFGNNSVKMCKGRQKKSCDQCFKINNLFEKLECNDCGNILCAKCGQDWHSPSFCFQQTNFRKIIENSTNFIEILDYKICPNCNQAVEKSIGCNSVICKCSQAFCYICEQKWLPNHSKHGHCYRREQIQALRKDREKKAKNNTEYTQKLQKQKEKIETLIFKIKQVKQIDVKKIREQMMETFKILSNQLDYLEPLVKKLRIALMAAKGYIVSLYFQDNVIKGIEEQNLHIYIENVYNFLICELPILIEAFSNKPIVSKKAHQIRKKNIINPQQMLANIKVSMLQSMKNLQKYSLVID